MTKTKQILLPALLLFSFVLPACMQNTGNSKDVQIDYGNSEIYTREDMDAAIAKIRSEFDGWEGCKLHSLRYGSDESSSPETLDWMNELGDGPEYTECIRFISDFHSPKQSGGPLNPDQEYTDYSWYLARTDDGDWDLLTWGY